MEVRKDLHDKHVVVLLCGGVCSRQDSILGEGTRVKVTNGLVHASSTGTL
jgi:hypothetical protein